jgi:hypothetical protein
MERDMTEAVTITNEVLAILCDIMSGWKREGRPKSECGKAPDP